MARAPEATAHERDATAARRSDRFYVRATRSQKELLAKAAAISGKSQTDFVHDAVARAIDEAFKRIEIIDLDREATENLQRLITSSEVSAPVLARFKQARSAVYRP
jgi:uncharacterized protein (DUF1778 family)